jgi:hypothetical protein
MLKEVTIEVVTYRLHHPVDSPEHYPEGKLRDNPLVVVVAVSSLE